MGQSSENRLRAYMPMTDLDDVREFAFTDIRNFQVLNTTGHRVGTVKEVFVDPNSLEPHAALLNYEAGFKLRNRNRKSFLVPWEELIIGTDYVQTRWTETELSPETAAEQARNLAEHDAAAEAPDDAVITSPV